MDLNELHLPEDATAEEAEALTAIMRRIPDGWGRWISCDRGWYPLIIELDRQLSELDPDYEVNQVKEKFGLLRFYFEPSQNVRRDVSDKTRDKMRWLEREVESISAVTCETCGAAGELCKTVSTWPWFKTLCAEHRDSSRGRFVPARSEP